MSHNQQRSGDIISGINVTPLVDVTLVLLIIFMVTAKIIVAPAVPLDLPPASRSEDVQIVLSIIVPATGSTLVDGTPVGTDAVLTERAHTQQIQNPDLRAVIQADGAVPHRRVIAVLDALRSAGISRIAFGVQAHQETTP